MGAQSDGLDFVFWQGNGKKGEWGGLVGELCPRVVVGGRREWGGGVEEQGFKWKEEKIQTLVMKKMSAQEFHVCVSLVAPPHQDIGLPRFSGFPKRLAAVVAASAVLAVPRRWQWLEAA